MTISSFQKLSICLVLLVLAAGCVSLKSTPDPTRYYLLNGASDAESLAPNPTNTGPVVWLAPVTLDPYLDDPYMVLRLQEHEVQFSDIHRWGEELSTNIRRALALDLMATGAVRGVVMNSGEAADYVVRIHVRRFEGVPPDIAHLSATWSLYDAEGTLLHTTSHDDRSRGWVFENYGHLAEMLDDALVQLATAIAAHLS